MILENDPNVLRACQPDVSFSLSGHGRLHRRPVPTLRLHARSIRPGQTVPSRILLPIRHDLPHAGGAPLSACLRARVRSSKLLLISSVPTSCFHGLAQCPAGAACMEYNNNTALASDTKCTMAGGSRTSIGLSACCTKNIGRLDCIALVFVNLSLPPHTNTHARARTQAM